jgi:hypothetical protein
VLLEVPPVIVSPVLKVPCTFETTTTPCVAVAEVNPVTLTAVVPSVSYNSKVVESGFLTV